MVEMYKQKINWNHHKKVWSNCTECNYCEQAKQVVLLRGSIPSDVMFVGEAPGHSENSLGQPFIGPAGQLLQTMLDEYLDNTKYCLTNLIGCIPLSEEGKKLREPENHAIKSCSPRIVDLFQLVKPKVVVTVGKLATKWIPKILQDFEFYMEEIIHPAVILRLDASQKGLAIRQTELVLEDVVDYLEGDKD